MLLFLQEAQARVFSTDVMANFIGGQIESQISSLAQAHGVVGDLELALAEGGTLGVDNFLKDTEAKRCTRRGS